jgi:release factor H-coupled RctB family protein
LATLQTVPRLARKKKGNMTTVTETKMRLIASPHSWIEDEAIRQLYATARLDGIRIAVGFPDLHRGHGAPVGAAFVTDDMLYPHLIGADIGCGMALFKIGLVQRDINLDRWAELRFDLEQAWEGNAGAALAAAGVDATQFDTAFGTLGRGNHFAELQVVQEVQDRPEFKRFGLGKQQLVALIHSGSRGLGEAVLQAYAEEHQANGSAAGSFAAAAYVREHDRAMRWAKANRALIARRFVEALGADAELLWDASHNSITRRQNDGETAWVHRKGAIPVEGECVIIPGSRGSLTYLVKPIGDGLSHAWSLAHGAGRKWSRSTTRSRMRERFSAAELMRTPLGGRVICEERDLLYEEAPAAYKNIDDVVRDLVEARLVTVVATFRPVLTYKTRALRR